MCGGLVSISPDLVFQHAVFVGDALAQMHELEPRFDQVALLEAPELSHVLENAPGEGAVALPLVAQFVHGAQEALAVLRVDPVLDLDENRALIVGDVLGRLRALPVHRRRQIDDGAFLQFPPRGERNADENPGGGQKQGFLEPDPCLQSGPRRRC